MSGGIGGGEGGVPEDLLDTKGQVHGFTTTNAAVNVGANDTIIYADSAQAAGIGYGASAKSILATTGDLLAASSANTLSALTASATSGHVLTSTGAASLPTYQAIPSSGAFTEIANQSQGGGANQVNVVSLTNQGDFVYFQFAFSFGVQTDALRLRLGVGGAVDTGSSYRYNLSTDGGTFADSGAGVTFIELTSGNATGDMYGTGFMQLNAPENTTLGTRTGYVVTYRAGQTFQTSFNYAESTSPITNWRFYATTGNDIMGSVNIWASA